MRRIYIFHVGSVTNKGTYALLKSDVLELRRMYKNAEIHVSTSDVETLRSLEPALKIHPLLVDIPYERADIEARKNKYGRETLNYKFHALAYVITMFLQALLSIISSLLAKVDFNYIYRPEVIKQLKDSDLIVSASDENFKEGSMYFPLNIYWKLAGWSVLFSRMWDTVIAKKIFNKQIVVFPNSVGPFRTWLGRFMARTLLNNVDFLLLRDPDSYTLLKDLKIKTPIRITVDTALLLKSNRMRVGGALTKPVVGVFPALCSYSFSAKTQRDYVLAHCKTLDHLVKKYGFNVVFLPHEVTGLKDDDLALCKVILQNMTYKDRVRIINAKTLEEFKNYIGQLDLVITSRMHPTVLACSDKVPTVTIFYDHKQTGFLKRLGLGHFTLNINEVSYEKLLSKVELVWSNRKSIKKHLMLEIPMLQKEVRAEITKAVERTI